MALSDIIAKIDRDADQLREHIRNEARNAAETILAHAREEVAGIEALAKSDAERAASKARGRIVAGATHEAKFAVQSFRSSLIERTFSEAEEALSKLPKEEYRVFVISRAKTIPREEGVLTLPAEREDETRSLLKETGAKVRDTRVAKRGELLGGFIFETRSAVYDHSLRATILDARTRYSGEVAQKLFAS